VSATTSAAGPIFCADVFAEGKPCETGCGAGVIPVTVLNQDHRPALVETVPGHPMWFGVEHTPTRCQALRTPETP
jgi:hypothetical protein